MCGLRLGVGAPPPRAGRGHAADFNRRADDHDVTSAAEKMLKGRVPARSVVIPGMRPRKFPAGEYLTPCALIIGQRTKSTDRKTTLNMALRDFGVQV